MILGDSTNLSLQAETDIITTDEGRHENGGSDIILYYSVFTCFWFILYLCTLIAEIIPRYSNQTVQILSNNVGL